MVQPGRLITEGTHLLEAVGHDDDRAPLILELGELVHALVLEFHITHGQDSSTRRMSGSTWMDTEKPGAHTCPRNKFFTG